MLAQCLDAGIATSHTFSDADRLRLQDIDRLCTDLRRTLSAAGVREDVEGISWAQLEPEPIQTNVKRWNAYGSGFDFYIYPDEVVIVAKSYVFSVDGRRERVLGMPYDRFEHVQAALQGIAAAKTLSISQGRQAAIDNVAEQLSAAVSDGGGRPTTGPSKPQGPYELLGVDRRASKAEVDAAWKRDSLGAIQTR